MFYFLVKNDLDFTQYNQLTTEIVNDLGGSNKNIRIVNYYQSLGSHYDFYKICAYLVGTGRDSNAGSSFVVCADVPAKNTLFMLLKHEHRILFKIKVDECNFLNEQQTFLMHKLAGYLDRNSYKKSTRENDISELRKKLIDSLNTNWDE